MKTESQFQIEKKPKKRDCNKRSRESELLSIVSPRTNHAALAVSRHAKSADDVSGCLLSTPDAKRLPTGATARGLRPTLRIVRLY